MAKLLLFAFDRVLLCVSGFAAEGRRRLRGAYGLNDPIAALESQAEIGDGLTRLGLQLWSPSPDGRDFAKHRVDFLRAMLAEINKYQLDCIGLNRQGEG